MFASQAFPSCLSVGQSLLRRLTNYTENCLENIEKIKMWVYFYLFFWISFPVLLNFIVMSLFAINRRLGGSPRPGSGVEHFKFPFWTLLFVKSQWGSICNFEHEENSLIWKVYGYQLQFWSHYLNSISKQRFLIN